jgi:hypothetical protein
MEELSRMHPIMWVAMFFVATVALGWLLGAFKGD